MQLVKVYGARIAFDILAMVGVGMMFYRIKLGWTFYWIFQLAYVLVPFFILGFSLTTSWPMCRKCSYCFSIVFCNDSLSLCFFFRSKERVELVSPLFSVY